jgi:arylsulfatase A-like enzyme
MKTNKKYLIAAFIVILLSIYAVFGFHAKRSRPNVIFITLDALRPDHLNCYGYKRNTSPNIGALAERGILFKQAISQASWTCPSVSSIISSLYPDHEIRESGYSLSPKDDNLVRILKSNGYATAIFSNAKPVLDITLDGLKDVFDVFSISSLRADAIVKSANKWVAENDRKPFFLWVYLYDTHLPYSAQPGYFTEFLSDNLHPHVNVPITPDDGVKNEHFSFGSLPRHAAENGITDTSYYIAKYDGGIKFADEQVGLLLKALEDRGLKDNTLIIFFSDHGESLTEHKFFFNHSHFLYEDLIRVPLIIVFPARLPRMIIEKQVQLINIVPTVREILKIKNNLHMEGRSMLPLIEKKVSQLDTYVFSETSYRPSPMCIRTEDWKLIRNRRPGDKYPELELYNLKADPRELHNLADVRLEIVASLVKRLKEWQQTAKTCSFSLKQDISQHEKEKLKSLGYAE